MTDWPATLPAAPLLDGFKETPPDLALRTDMEQGPAKLRRRTTAGVARFSLSYFLTQAQTATLAAFYTDDTQGGTLPFGFSHPRTGGALQCRFVHPPQIFALGGTYFRAQMELEVLP